MKLASGVLVASVAARTLAANSSAPSAAAIKGPIPVVAGSDEPFRGNNAQPVAGPGLPPPVLIPFGYVEEEYVVSGVVDGRAYSTSLLVRKPSDSAKFSGLVAVETIHAGGAIPFWGAGGQFWMPNGHAWVAVASQRAALQDRAKPANPKRYASLDVPDLGGGAPSSSNPGPNQQDLFSQAIMTQVGQLLKNNDSQGPLQKMHVRKLIMGGASQTGDTTLRYIENSHARAIRPDGKPIYDGYMPTMAFPRAPLPVVNVPVMHVVVEADLMNALREGRAVEVGPDRDARNAGYRHYQLTGASHVVTRGMTDPAQVSPNLKNGLKPGEQLSQFPNVPFFNAFLDAFVPWVLRDVAPPSAPRIARVNGTISRDAVGNALGGIRSPYVDIPTVHYVASAMGGNGDDPSRRMFGIQEGIPAEQLKQRYSSRTNYLRQFNEQIDRLAADRWVRHADGEVLKTEEARNPLLSALS